MIEYQIIVQNFSKLGTWLARYLALGYLRDVLVFTWKNHTLAGHEHIAAYLKDTLKPASITQLKLAFRANLTPEFGHITHAAEVSSGFTFETAVGHGEAYFSLVENGTEAGLEKGVCGGHTLAWHDVYREHREAIERDPHTLNYLGVGGGQTGLNVGVRFRKMNIATLIIERNVRIGDNWRHRYPMLTLHTIKTQHTSNHQSSRLSVPEVTIFQCYINPTPITGLPIHRGTKSEIGSNNLVINRVGEQVILHPTQIVLAAGTGPYVPAIPDADVFSGTKIHSPEYKGGKEFLGNRVLVAGAGNSSADISQDLAFQGSSELERRWPADVPTDFKVQVMPYLLLCEIGRATTKHMWAEENETHKG
ncbi:hypothetical protein K438DRAFT_1772336 [Mycena galopus ATCC 62051]|nr:hypothetical protein K438DRAFT_1772336 [Mycena galopus ATCC 62051]